MLLPASIPTKLVCGEGCVTNNTWLFDIGKKAFIVTGRHGAKASGALDDVVSALNALSIAYTVFAEVEANPSLDTAYLGGKLAFASGADFLIAIGGGSAIDAGKAIAAFAANPDIEAEELFESEKRVNASLPIIAIPTTAGTGSEANQYSVLTLGKEKKRTFSARDNYPRLSFLDPRYTYSLSDNTTMSTALDAFAHAIESYLSPRATSESDALSLYAAKAIWDVISETQTGFTAGDRADLIYASCAAGAAISETGTGFPHPLGYSITLHNDIPHGAACAIFEGDYISLNLKTAEGRRRLSVFADHLNTTPKKLAEALPKLSGIKLSLNEDEIEHYVELIASARNYTNSPYVLTKPEMLEIYRSHFLK